MPYIWIYIVYKSLLFLFDKIKQIFLQTSQAVMVPGQEPLTATMLAAAPPQEQKQLLGERLFPLISRYHSALAGKITGMLLEIDNTELLHMLESQESLRSKVTENNDNIEQKINAWYKKIYYFNLELLWCCSTLLL